MAKLSRTQSSNVLFIVSIICQEQNHSYQQKCQANSGKKVATDLFVWRKSQYLLVVDYYSQFIEISKVSTASSPHVIIHLNSIFARHVIPQTIYPIMGHSTLSINLPHFYNNMGSLTSPAALSTPKPTGKLKKQLRLSKICYIRINVHVFCLVSPQVNPNH